MPVRPASALGFPGGLSRRCALLVSFVLLVLGLALLVGGADLLIRGAAAIASAFGLPSVVIGMTIVAFGTSTPEVVINATAALQGETGLAFGNVVGSCSINIGFVLALTALVRPLAVARSIVSREIPMLLLAAAAMAVMSADVALDRAPENLLNRGDGLMLLLLFGVFLYYTIVEVGWNHGHDRFVAEATDRATAYEAEPAPARPHWGRDVALTLGGLLGVAVGGRLTVKGAVAIAGSLGVPEVVIGLTLVSFGTTLPELTTCLLAARRGQPDIALGNIVGSNILNILFIGGLVAIIRPVPLPAGGLVDLLVMVGLCVVLLPMALRGPRRITRGEGATLLALYLAYFIFRWAAALA